MGKGEKTGNTTKDGKTGNTTKDGNSTKGVKTFTQTVTAEMSCDNVKKIMENQTIATKAFQEAFEKSSGVKVSDTKLQKKDCPRRLEQSFRRLSTGAIQADFTYTSTETAATVQTEDFKTKVNEELEKVGLPKAVTGVKAAAATETTPTATTAKPGATTSKVASGALKTQLVPVALGFLLLAIA